MRPADLNVALLIILTWLGLAGALRAAPIVNVASAPDARSLAIGATGGVFVEFVNSGDATALQCRIFNPLRFTPQEGVLDFSYQAVDAGGNLVGGSFTPVDIPAGASQRFVVTVTAKLAFEGRLHLKYFCDNVIPYTFEDTNDLFLTISAGDPPDLIAIFATPSGDGVLRVGAADGSEAAGGAVVNIGSAGGVATVDVTPTFSSFNDVLGVHLFICETDPVSGACMATPAPSISMDVSGAANTFSVFAIADAGLGVPLFPEYVRISVVFSDPAPAADAPQGGAGAVPQAISGSTRGRASVAFTSPADSVAVAGLANPFAGRYVLRMRDMIVDFNSDFISDGDLSIDDQLQSMGIYHRQSSVGTDNGDEVFFLKGAFDAAAKTFAGELVFVPGIFRRNPPLRGDFTAAFDSARSMRGTYSVKPAADAPQKGQAGGPARPLIGAADSSDVQATGVASKRDFTCAIFDTIPPQGKKFDVFLDTMKIGMVTISPDPDNPDGFIYTGTVTKRDEVNSTTTDFNIMGKITPRGALEDIPFIGLFGGTKDATIKLNLTDTGDVAYDGAIGEVTRCTATGFTMGTIAAGPDGILHTDDDTSLVLRFEMPMP